MRDRPRGSRGALRRHCGMASRALTDEVEQRRLELTGIDAAGCGAGGERELRADRARRARAATALRSGRSPRRDRRLRRAARRAARRPVAGASSARNPRRPSAPRWLKRVSFCRATSRLARAPLDHLQIAEHDGQQIVEIMRDAAGQLADRLELLGVAQRLLDLARASVASRSRGGDWPRRVRACARRLCCSRVSLSSAAPARPAQAQQGIDRGDELVRLDRLDQVGIGAAVKAAPRDPAAR